MTDDQAGQMDFALRFARAHEVPSQERFLAEIARALAPGKKALFAEPAGHVPGGDLERPLADCRAGAATERCSCAPELSDCRPRASPP